MITASSGVVTTSSGGFAMGEADRAVAVDLWRVAVPLRLPFEAAHGTEDERHSVLIAVRRADGGLGWGECVALTRPTYTHEYAAGAFALLRDVVAPAVLEAGGEPTGAVQRARKAARWHPMAAAGMEGALVDGALRARGRALVDWLRSPDALAVGVGAVGAVGALARTVVIGRQPTMDALLSAVERARVGGAAMVKLKLAGPDDADAVTIVRRTWPDLALAADANGALVPSDGSPLQDLTWIDGLGLTYLEQPCPADDLLASARLARRLTTPIALDESVTTPAMAQLAHQLGAGAILNVKPARLGGFAPTRALVDWARVNGVDAFCGGMVELGIGRATAAACAALDGLTLPTDLGPSASYVVEDLTDPIVVDDAGRLVVPRGVGCGVDPHVDRLRAATREHVTIPRSP